MRGLWGNNVQGAAPTYVCMYIKSKREGGERINIGSCCEMYHISICRLMKLGNELRLLYLPRGLSRTPARGVQVMVEGNENEREHQAIQVSRVDSFSFLPAGRHMMHSGAPAVARFLVPFSLYFFFISPHAVVDIIGGEYTCQVPYVRESGTQEFYINFPTGGCCGSGEESQQTALLQQQPPRCGVPVCQSTGSVWC